MRLLLNTHCANEHYDGIEYAFLDLQSDLARKILARMQAFERLQASDPDLTHVEYYDASALYLHGLPDDDGEPWEPLPYGEPYVELDVPHGRADALVAQLEEYQQDTECDRMVIDASRVYWTCYPTNTAYEVETSPIERQKIEEAAGKA